jgi:PAS domain S-box-containing protein
MWNRRLVLLHVTSDTLIALAYFSIPLTLIYFVRKRRDLPFHWMFLCFGVFIWACGATHAMEVWTLWHANYWFSGAVKAVTAMASVPTAILLTQLVPKALELPSPEAMRAEIIERKRAEEALHAANDALEMRVKERTAELTDAHQKSLAEIERRTAVEESLRRSEERFRLLVERVTDYAIFTLDPNGNVTSWNAGAERIKGYLAEEILGAHFSRFYLAEDLAWNKPDEELRIAASEGRYEEEGWRLRKDGSPFWASVVITALRHSDGTLVGFSKITRDLTERKRAEETLEAARAELAHASRVSTMGELVGSISHEINQPLTAVIADANACRRMLASSDPDIAEVKDAVTDIAASATRASEVISRIRSLLRKTTPEKTPLDVKEVIDETLQLVRGELDTRNVVVQTELPVNPPLVLGDRIQLQQVVLNLIMNGIEAMDRVADRPRILKIKAATEKPGNLNVEVHDNGIGLDVENPERVFDTFFTTKAHGMGMGLSISRTIIEAHGGRLLPLPSNGQGTVFQFTLPVAA